MNYAKFAFLLLILVNQSCLSSQKNLPEASSKSCVSIRSLCLFGAGIIVGGIAHAFMQPQIACDHRLAIQADRFNTMEELRIQYRMGYDPQLTSEISPYASEFSMYWEYRGPLARECGRLQRAEHDAKKRKNKK